MKKLIVCMLFFVLFAAIGGAQTIDWSKSSILFSGSKNGIWDLYLWSNGEYQNITNSPDPEGNPIFWPSENLILASKPMGHGKFGLAAFTPAGKQIWSCKDEDGALGWPIPSPWDKRILAIKELPNGWTQPGIITYPSGKFEAFPETGLSGGQMAWVDQNTILLSRKTVEGFDIYERDLISGKEEPVVQGGVNWQTTSLPNKNKFYFSRRVGQVCSIFRLTKNNGKWEYENETNSRTYDWQARISPCGEYLVYKSMIFGQFVTLIRDLATKRVVDIPFDGFQQIFHPSLVELSINGK
jgi:hypothetical protein